MIANDPSVVQAVVSANHQYERLSDDAVVSKLEATEQKWNNSKGDALAKDILTSDLARQLRRMRELNPSLLKVTVADASGATVAATDKPVRYFQMNRGYWGRLYSQGQGAIDVVALFVMILSLLMLSLLAAYVFLHRVQKLEDIETPPEEKPRPAAA